jgi:hypothetical protein
MKTLIPAGTKHRSGQFELSFVSFTAFLDQSAMGEIGWWNIIGGNILVLAAIISYYDWGHRRVVPRLIERWHRMRDEPAAARRDARSSR